MTHICVGNLTIIASDNGLSPERRQAIIWTNAGILLIGPLGTNFSEILIEIQTFSLKKIRLKMSSAKCCSFRLGLNVLIMPWLWTGGKSLVDTMLGLLLTGWLGIILSKIWIKKSYLYHNYEKYPLSPLKPRCLALIEKYLHIISDPNLIGSESGLSFVYLQSLLIHFINVCAKIYVIWNRKLITSQWATEKTSSFNFFKLFFFISWPPGIASKELNMKI